MAGERTVPGGLALTAFWDLYSAYKAQMDDNLRKLSILAQLVVDSEESSEPGAPTDGDIHLATGAWGGGSTHDIIARDDGAWVALTPFEGLLCYNKATDAWKEFDGSAWVDHLPTVPTNTVTNVASSRNMTDGDFAGGQVLEGDGITLTIPSGLSGTEPCTVIQDGSTAVTIAAGGGVTIHSKGGLLDTNGQYAALSIIPKGSDVYYVVGDLA